MTQQVMPKSRGRRIPAYFPQLLSFPLLIETFPTIFWQNCLSSLAGLFMPILPSEAISVKGVGFLSHPGAGAGGMPGHRIDLLLQDVPTSNFCLRSSAKENTSLFVQVPVPWEGKDWISKELMIFGVTIPLYHES